MTQKKNNKQHQKLQKKLLLSEKNLNFFTVSKQQVKVIYQIRIVTWLADITTRKLLKKIERNLEKFFNISKFD